MHNTQLEPLITKWQNFFLNLPFPYFPLKTHSYKIVWNKKMRTRAGLCRPRDAVIELNPNILIKIEDIEQTLVHELCHLAVSRRYPWAEPHGMRWKKLMKHCGLKPERCHQIEIAKINKQRRWEIKCECRTHLVSTRIYNKISKGVAYKCIKCKSVLISPPHKNIEKQLGFFEKLKTALTEV